MSLFFFIFADMMFNWLSLVTGFFYIVLGVVVIIYRFFIVSLEPNVALALGVILVLYGIFRLFRAINKLKNTRDEEA